MKKLAAIAFAAACGLANAQTANVAPPAGAPGSEVRMSPAPMVAAPAAPAPALAPAAPAKPSAVVKHRQTDRTAHQAGASKRAPTKKHAARKAHKPAKTAHKAARKTTHKTTQKAAHKPAHKTAHKSSHRTTKVAHRAAQ